MIKIPALIVRLINLISDWLVKVGDLPTIRSARTALIFTTPLLAAGSFASLINNLPIEGYKEFMVSVFGPGWTSFPETILNATFGIISIVMVFTISQQMVRGHNLKRPLQAINMTIPALTAQMALFCLILKPAVPAADRWSFTGVGGLFVAILVAVITTKSFIWLAGRPFLRLKIGTAGADMLTGQVLDLLFPGLIIVVATVLFDQVLFAGGDTIYNFISGLIRIPFQKMDSELGQGLLYIAICQMAWFFGIHGSNLMDSVTHAVFENATLDNLLAANAGLAPPHIITKQFLDVFVYLGGSGATIGLVLAIFVIGRGRGTRKIAQLSALPTVFNVNELVIFGVPVVLNPIYLIPFLATPIILAIISYLTIYLGWAPNRVADPQMAPWTSPALLSGYLVTRSWHGPALQLINIAVSFVCYLPFVALADRSALARFKTTMAEILAISSQNETKSGKKYIHRSDDIGMAARALSVELEQALKKGPEVYLEYQPQVRADTNQVEGVEALVRWRHPIYGPIAPPIVIGLAEDGDFIGRLGLKILNDACAQRKAWLDQGLEKLVMSVNISVHQLREPGFEASVLETIRSHGLPPSAIKIEVTESVALTPGAPSDRILTSLNKKGVKLAIDDFGAGHSTLLYFKQFPVSTLKIDRVLSKDVLGSETSANIIATIVKLCESINAEVIVEFVNEQKQLEALYALGCRIFQGYLFSRPLSAEACLEYIRQSPSRPSLIPASLLKPR